MTTVKIYGVRYSAPTRILLMTCKVLGVNYELIETDPMKGDTRTEEFSQLNPTHTIPVLVDGDFIVSESRAAAAYLINSYGWDGCNLYPTDTKTRALVDQRLYFDIGTFYKALADCSSAVLFHGAKEPGPKLLHRMKETLEFLQEFLAPTGFVAGTDYMTLADISCLATFHTLCACDYFDMAEFKDEIKDWCSRCTELIPDYEDSNRAGALEFGDIVKSKMEAN